MLQDGYIKLTESSQSLDCYAVRWDKQNLLKEGVVLSETENYKENRDHCKRISDELQEICEGHVFKCPECGATFNYFEDDEEHMFCSECGEELEPYTIYDYFEDDIYDVEYRCDGDKEYRSVEVMIACGGPNIYIDTGDRKVKLYWWTDYADWNISTEVADEIDSYFEEMFCNS